MSYDNNGVYNGSAKLLTKLFRYLFLLNIGITLSSLILADAFSTIIPNLYWPGVILDIGCTFGYGVILLRMSAVDNQYRTAAYSLLIAGAVRLLATDISANSSKFVVLLSVATAIVRFVGEYNEMTAHDLQLVEIDFNLSEKWTRLRKWYMFAFLTYCVSLMIVILLPTVGAVISIAASFAMIIINAMKIYYLYLSHKAFDAV